MSKQGPESPEGGGEDTSGHTQDQTYEYTNAPVFRNLGALREIPEFEPEKDGGIGVTDFLEAVENAAFLGNLSYDDLMRVMVMRLRGPARSFYRPFLASKQVSPEGAGLGKLWLTFKQGLKDRFRKTTDPVAYLMQLTSCQQGDTETVRGYAQRVKALAYRTWPQFTQSQDEATRRMGESLIYQHFLKGLKPANIERIHLKGIRDMDMAVLELTNKETFDALQRTGRSVRVNHVGTGEETATAAQELRGEMQELRETVTAHLAETAELLRAHANASLPVAAPYTEGEGYEPYGFPYAEPLYPSDPFEGDGVSPGTPYNLTQCPVNAVGPGPYRPAPHVGSQAFANSSGYRPRLPQYPILRPAAPRGLAVAPFRSAEPGRPRVACYYCRGPHYVRSCPCLPPPGPGAFLPGRVPGEARGPRMARPGAPGANYPAGGRNPLPPPPPRQGGAAPEPALNG